MRRETYNEVTKNKVSSEIDDGVSFVNNQSLDTGTYERLRDRAFAFSAVTIYVTETYRRGSESIAKELVV